MTERSQRMRGGDGRGSPVSRRVLLAAGGAVLLTSTAAAVDADARAHGLGAQPRPAPNVPANWADGTSRHVRHAGQHLLKSRRGPCCGPADPEAFRVGSAASGVDPVRDAAVAAAAPAALR